MEKVTVIIPAYNVEKCIEQCIQSVCEQTYSNLEIILINDGSLDSTGEICRNWKKKSANIFLLERKNGGVSRARNLGIEKASGTYLMFVDADDYLDKNAVENLMRYHQEAEWVIGNYWITDVLRGESGIHEQYFQGAYSCGNKEELPKLCESRNFNCVWAKLYRRDVIQKYNLRFDEGRSYGEDLMFNCSYFSHIESFVILKVPIYHYCYQYGEGLGTRYLSDEWKIQEEMCRKIREMTKTVYRLSPQSQIYMNHFYYAQAIASLQRIAAEKSISKKEKKEKIGQLTHSNFFSSILNQEYEQQRINKLDFLLLKNHRGLLYDILHRWYVHLKKIAGRVKF